MNSIEILALTKIKGIGNAFVKRHIDHLRTDMSLDAFLKEKGMSIPEETSTDQFLTYAHNIAEECQSKGYKFISIVDPDYPELLKELPDPPAILYAKGNMSLLNNVLTIIGTRHSTVMGNKIAEKVGAYFSQKFAICNGLVEGIDESVVTCEGKVHSNVIGVISGGLNYETTCSKEHAVLIEKVLQANGLIVTEFEPGMKEDQYSGSKASRIQAGLAKGMILIQSSINGGSKYTVKAFSRLNRVLGVISVPGKEEYTTDAFSANRIILEQGAEGIAKFIGLKSAKDTRQKKIVKIEGLQNYREFEQSVSEEEFCLW